MPGLTITLGFIGVFAHHMRIVVLQLSHKYETTVPTNHTLMASRKIVGCFGEHNMSLGVAVSTRIKR